MDGRLNRAASKRSQRLLVLAYGIADSALACQHRNLSDHARQFTVAVALGVAFGSVSQAENPGLYGRPQRISPQTISTQTISTQISSPQRLPKGITTSEPSSNVGNQSQIIREPEEFKRPMAPVRQPLPQKVNISETTATTPATLSSTRFPSPVQPDVRDIDALGLDKQLQWSPVTLRVEAQETNIQPGFSLASLRLSAAKLSDESAISLSHGASHSATAAATEALRSIAQAVDTSRGDSLATMNVVAALLSIREAEDFVGRYGHVDADAIARMVRSHETTVLKDFDTSQLTGLVAADIYLDTARQKLTMIAATDPLAAHAIALLAKSYRQRASDNSLALATSVHLMRAAALASPNDRGLAMEFASVLEQAELRDEAKEVFTKAMRIPSATDGNAVDEDSMIVVVSGLDDGAASRSTQHAIQVEQVSPEAFASVSLEAGPTGSPMPRTTLPPVAAEPQTSTGNPMSRAFKSMTKIWR